MNSLYKGIDDDDNNNNNIVRVTEIILLFDWNFVMYSRILSQNPTTESHDFV